MTYQAIYSAIEATVQAAIGSTPLQLPNRFIDPSSAATYARISHLPARPRAVTLGIGGQDLRPGLTQVDVFTKPGAGTNTLPDDIVNAFGRSVRYALDNGEVFSVTAYRDGGQLVEKGYWQERITIVWNALVST